MHAKNCCSYKFSRVPSHGFGIICYCTYVGSISCDLSVELRMSPQNKENWDDLEPRNYKRAKLGHEPPNEPVKLGWLVDALIFGILHNENCIALCLNTLLFFIPRYPHPITAGASAHPPLWGRVWRMRLIMGRHRTPHKHSTSGNPGFEPWTDTNPPPCGF